MSRLGRLYRHPAVERVRLGAGGLERRIRRMLGKPGIKLSVVVPVYNVEGYVREALGSLRQQLFTAMEIIVVDDGSTDDSLRIVEECRALDSRIRVIRQPHAGPGAARNAGIREARGEYLTFADSDDVVPPRAYLHMIRSLSRSGSVFVVGGLERMAGAARWSYPWVRRAHAVDRTGITLDELPEITKNVFAWNKMFRSDFFRRSIGGFPEGVLHEDQEPAALAYTTAGRFDVLAETVYLWRSRLEGGSITQGNAGLRSLEDRIAVAERVAEVYAAASPAVQHARWQDFVGDDFSQFTRTIPEASGEYFSLISGYVAGLFERLPGDLWAGVAPRERALAYAVAHRSRAEVEALIEAQAGRPGVPVTQDHARIDVAAWGADPEGWPEHIVSLNDSDRTLATGITRIGWQGQRLVIEGFALLDPLPVAPDGIEVSLVSPDADPASQPQSGLPVERFEFADSNPELPQQSGLPIPGCGFRVSLDASAIRGEHALRVRATVGELSLEGPLTVQDAEHRPALAAHPDGSGAIAVRTDAAERLILQRVRGRAQAPSFLHNSAIARIRRKLSTI